MEATSTSQLHVYDDAVYANYYATAMGDKRKRHHDEQRAKVNKTDSEGSKMR